MEWEVKLIELIQNNMGSLGILLGEFFSFLASEKGLLLLLLIMMFCWKKDTDKKLTMTVVSLNVWLPMIKTLVMRPRPYMSYPERIKPLVLVEADAAWKISGAISKSITINNNIFSIKKTVVRQSH